MCTQQKQETLTGIKIDRRTEDMDQLSKGIRCSGTLEKLRFLRSVSMLKGQLLGLTKQLWH